MQALITKAQMGEKPFLESRTPKAIPRKRYPMKTGSVQGSAARSAFFFIIKTDSFRKIYRLGKGRNLPPVFLYFIAVARRSQEGIAECT